MPTYSKDEAEARLDEILRKVQAGERVVIALDGEEIAEVRPIPKNAALEDRMADLQRRGVIGPLVQNEGRLHPIAERPGALARFLRSRD